LIFLSAINLAVKMSETFRLELLVEPWATQYYKNEMRSNENAGYDLYCQQIDVPGTSLTTVGSVSFQAPVLTMLDHGVRARMISTKPLQMAQVHASNHYTAGIVAEQEVHYYLVPRSSICKSPLIMANSVGIIDKTYRGPIKAPVKNLSSTPYSVTEGTRLFQIIAPNMGHISEVRLVQSLDETARGEGGFGSTGQ
jgi:hypothetical protein